MKVPFRLQSPACSDLLFYPTTNTKRSHVSPSLNIYPLSSFPPSPSMKHITQLNKTHFHLIFYYIWVNNAQTFNGTRFYLYKTQTASVLHFQRRMVQKAIAETEPNENTATFGVQSFLVTSTFLFSWFCFLYSFHWQQKTILTWYLSSISFLVLSSNTEFIFVTNLQTC